MAIIGDIAEWKKLIGDIAKELKCLPSEFPDDNSHIVRKANELITEHQSYKEQLERAEKIVNAVGYNKLDNGEYQYRGSL